MQRLIENGMLYGRLMRVDAPHLVERYNRALERMGMQRTALERFHIDASGYSLEIADELGDTSYLDPQGVNRRFIILSGEQRTLPLIRTHFSSDIGILRRFFEANARMIDVVTLRDALYGEIENLVFAVERIEDLLAIGSVSFQVHSANGLIDEARALADLAQEFEDEPGSWRNRALHARIVEAAKRCGDVRRNDTIPQNLVFPWPSAFHTTHFGGLYVLRRPSGPVLIGRPADGTEIPEGGRLLSLDDVAGVLAFLEEEALIEAPNAVWLKDSRLVEQRFRACVADILARSAPEVAPAELLDEGYFNRWVHKHTALLRGDARFRVLARARALLANGGDLERFIAGLAPEESVLLRRALPEDPDAWEVNRILSEFCGFDLISVFVLDKERFYALYEALDERRRDYAVGLIQTGYIDSKRQVRERLFGLH